MTKAKREGHDGKSPGHRVSAGRAGWVCLALLVMTGLARRSDPSRFESRQTHMGSEFTLFLYTSDASQASRAFEAAFARIAELDRALSDYNPESELMKLCDRAGGPAVVVSADLLRCLEQAEKMSRLSDGAFDVTIGPIGRLWRRARRTREMPDAQTLAKAKELVGYQNIQLDAKASTVKLAKHGMKLDLGAIAKGYACDEAIRVLKTKGITSALAAGAGDIVVSDAPPGRTGWRIGVAAPDGDPAKPSRFLSLANAAVSTSGDAEKFVEIDGKRYSHIVDPRTGLGVIDRASVTVVAKSGIIADGLDTTVYVLGPQKGMPIVEQTEGAASLYISVGGQPKTIASSRWDQLKNDDRPDGP